MDQNLLQTIVVFLVFVTVLGGSDAYVVRRWSQHSRNNNWPGWTRLTPVIIAWVMLPLTMTLMYFRRTDGQVSFWMNVGLIFSSVWYVSKFPILLVLLIRDVLRVLRWTGRQAVKLVRRVLPAQERSAAVAAPDLTRRKFVGNTGWALAGAPFLLTGYGVLRTVHNFQVMRHDVAIKNLPRQLEGLTIGQLSDIHAGAFPTSGPVHEIVELVMEQKADLLLVTGDWVNFDPRELKNIFPAFEKLQADLGVYGSLGNHDHYMSDADHRALKRGIRAGGVDLLVNENRVLNIDGGQLQLAGTDNSGLRQNFADLNAALRGFEDDLPTILMAHDPTFWDREVRGQTNVDLMLSGHTHGGQVGLHVLDREYSFAQIVYRQWIGMYRDGNQHLYVNRGLGTTALPIRIGINPELTLLTLRRA